MIGRRSPRDERGVTLITVALSMTAILGVASLSIDGGRMFGARRQAQNAADAAAAAGAEALFAYQYAATTSSPAAPSSINQAVVDKLAQNNMTGTSCSLVDATGSITKACADADDSDLTSASGVVAGATLSQATALAGVIGINRFNATARATAEVQPLVSASAPFIVCGASDTGLNILNSDGTINLNRARGLGQFAVEGSNTVPTCGADSAAFKGLAADGPPAGIGSLEGVTTGDRFKAGLPSAVAALAPCPDLNTGTIPAGGCGMIIPIASAAQGTGSSTKMLIANFGVFNVVPGPTGTGKYLGTFVAPATLATSGPGAFGVHCATGAQVCVIKLVG